MMPRPAVPTRRADILIAAREAFNARGFSATRMEDIARRCGISKAALYLQFPSKEALFQALTSEIIEQMLPEVAPADFGDTPAEDLLRSFVAVVASRLAQPDMAFVARVIIGEGMNFPELARFYHDNALSRGLGIAERIIRHGIARGEFAAGEPNFAARSVVGGILLMALWKIVFEPVGAEPLDVPAMAASHAETLLAGLKARKDAA
jgi:AcrR family transcriptional regulator